MAQHVRQGDMVMVLTGSKEVRQRAAKVLRVIPGKQQVIVEGVNVCRKHVKPTQQNPRGGVIEKELPISWSNVAPAVDGKPTRVRFPKQADGAKVRLAVKGGQPLGEPLRQAAK